MYLNLLADKLFLLTHPKWTAFVYHTNTDGVVDNTPSDDEDIVEDNFMEVHISTYRLNAFVIMNM